MEENENRFDDEPSNEEHIEVENNESIEEEEEKQIELESNGLESHEQDETVLVGEDSDSFKEEAEESEEPPQVNLESQIRNLQRNLIEGALYASGRPLDVEEISTKLEIPKKITDELVKELAFEYLERSSAIIINQVGEKFQMALRTEYVEKVAKFAKGGGIAERYLRTLTIIALKQPILKSTVIKVRGSGAYEHVKYLLDNEFIMAIKKGRTHELTTTDKYSEMFGLPKNKQELKKAMIDQLGVPEEEPKREEVPKNEEELNST